MSQDLDEWAVMLNIDGTSEIFKIYSGADCSVLGEATYNTLESKEILQKTMKVLNEPGGHLNCLGEFNAETVHNRRTYSLKLYVVRGENVNNLLSRQASLTMSLIK